MCGFYGFVDFDGNIRDVDEHEIKAGANKIAYRGPDDSGCFLDDNVIIYFRRLSIIDLEAPPQPYTNKKKTITMVCNGEIYNYMELKRALQLKGYKFFSKTDTEVILYGYEEWGEDLWAKLNGIFAIVLWDAEKKKLILVRDHLGVKPIHYFHKDRRVYFSSDYNSFFCQSYSKIQNNNDAILSYLSFRYVIGKQTFYKDVYDLEPGQSKTFFSKGSNSNYYWDIPTNTDKVDKGENYYLEALNSALKTAVKRQLMSDVPVGAFISGGLDSSTLLYYMHSISPNIKSYITGFEVPGYNEFYFADLIAEQLGITPRKLIIDPEEYAGMMDEVIGYRAEPPSIPHEAAFLKMSRFMKNEITVVLSGEGADELFGGYGRIFRSPHDYYKQKWFSGKHKTMIDHFLWRYSWFNDEDKSSMLNKDFIANGMFDQYSLMYIKSLFKKFNDNDYYRAMYYIQGKLHLPNLLNRLDRMTMASSIEGRVPFLDIDLVNIVSTIPIKYKLRWNNFSSKLKSIFYDSEIISEKYDTPKYILKKLMNNKITPEIINRKKMGFPVPLDNWFNDSLKDMAYSIIFDSNSYIRNIINVNNVKSLLNKKNNSSNYDYFGKKLWMLMNLELWYKKYF